jgi:hypothetical protein
MKDISAFPTPAHNLTNDGMTLRDYFAAKAMQGVLSRPTAGLLHAEDIAPAAYMMADAMLKARDAAQ